MEKRVLIVCMDYFPYEGACSSLLNKMIINGGLKEKIGSIDVLTVRANLNEPILSHNHDVTIRRVECWDYISKDKLIKQIKVAKKTKIAYGILVKFANKVYNKIFKSDIIIKFGVVKPIINAIREAEYENNYDFIIPIVGNHTVGYSVLQYALKYHKKYILYQVDPISDNFVLSHSQKETAKLFEYELYNNASAIITTPILKKRRYDEPINSKMYAMEFPNIAKVNISGEKKKSGNTENVECVFAGNIRGNIRDPKHTLLLFSKLKDYGICLKMIGVTNDQLDTRLLSENIIVEGEKTLVETREELYSADFLVNIGNVMINQVPSKIFEYISTGIPIINICKNRNCPTLDYLNKHKYAINIFEQDDVYSNAQKVRKFIHKNFGNRMEFNEILEVYRECTADYCATQFAKIVDKGEV